MLNNLRGATTWQRKLANKMTAVEIESEIRGGVPPVNGGTIYSVRKESVRGKRL